MEWVGSQVWEGGVVVTRALKHWLPFTLRSQINKTLTWRPPTTTPPPFGNAINWSPIFVIEADQQLTDEAVRFLVSFLRRLPFHRGESLAQHHQGSQNQTAARDWGKCYLHLPRILHRRFWWLADEVWWQLSALCVLSTILSSEDSSWIFISYSWK